MNKLLEFLEKNVQWIALGLGGVYLLWMVWSYIVQPPVAVQIAGENVTLATIDQETAEGPARQLDLQIKKVDGIDIKVEKFTDAWRNQMNSINENMVLAGRMFYTPLGEPVKIETQVQETNPAFVGMEPIKALPKLTAPVYKAKSQGSSVVMIPPAPAVPGAPAPAPMGVANTPRVEDRNWVSLSWTIPMKPIADAMAAVKMPEQLRKSVFLVIETEREELVDGKWTNATIIKPLENSGVLEMPVGSEGRAIEGTYLNWAMTHQADILIPAFYQVDRGDRWIPPGFVPPPPVDPNAAALEAKRRQEEAERLQRQQQPPRDLRRTPREPRGGSDGPPRNRRGRGMDDGMWQARRPPNLPPGVEYQGPPPGIDPYWEGGYEGMPPEAMTPGRPSDPALPPPPQVPQGEFVPATTPDVECWKHDDTAQPGATYRYRMRYKIKNPIWGISKLGDPSSLADTFALVSEYSDWSETVTIPTTINFFVKSNPLPNRETATFDVFRWQDGKQHVSTFVVAPGDPIGTEKDGVNFSTGYIVVDVRAPSAQMDGYILIADANGNIRRREFRIDEKNPEYKRLQDEARLAAQASAMTPR